MNDNFWMVVGPLLALLGVLATAAGGVFVARANRTASPYDALANRVTNLEQQRERDLAKIESQQTTIAELVARDGVAQTQIAGLERRVGAVINDRDGVVRYLVQFREWVALGSKPPVPPIPLHLRDVIPDWSPDDADRSMDVVIRQVPTPPDPVGP